MIKNFSQIKARYDTTDPGGSENTKRDKCKKNHTQILLLYVSFSNYWKSNIKRKEKKPERSQRKIATYL